MTRGVRKGVRPSSGSCRRSYPHSSRRKISVGGVQGGRPKFTTWHLIPHQGTKTPATPRRAAARHQRFRSRQQSWTAPQGFGEAALGVALTYARQAPSRTQEKKNGNAGRRQTRGAGRLRATNTAATATRPRGGTRKEKNEENEPHAARRTPPRRAIARQCAEAAQRLAQAGRWPDNNGRERNTNTLHTAAPRHRSPVRRGGATARSGVSLAR